MKLYIGKWFIAIRFPNDLCMGVGRPPASFLTQAVADRPHWPKRLWQGIPAEFDVIDEFDQAF